MSPRHLSGKHATALVMLAGLAIPAISISASCSSDSQGGGGTGGNTWGTTGTGGWGSSGSCVPENQQTSCIRTVPESIAPTIDCTPPKPGTPEYDGCTPNTPCGALNGCPLELCDPTDELVEAAYAPGPPGFIPPPTLLPPAGTEMLGRGTGWFARDDGTLDTGTCSFTPVRNLTGVALSTKNFGKADWCGACAEVVSESGKRVRVQIVDQCAGCDEQSLDMPAGADTPFSMLTDPDFQTAYQCPGYDGSLPISWHIVPCETEGGLRISYLEGFNAWQPAVRFSNHRLAIVRVEEQWEGAWKTLDRLEDNKYFLTPRPTDAPTPMVLRVTAIDGSTITATFPPFEPIKIHEAKAQF